MTTPPDSPALTHGQRLAADQLAEVAAHSAGAVEVLRGPYRSGAGQSVVIDIALDCSGLAQAPSGVRLRPREVFSLEVSPEFPFTVPAVRVPHTRWAGIPHVQWQKLLCLYAAPSVEWLPADGMRGLLDRLIQWLRQAAAGDLDPEGQPLHPPVAYASLAAGVAVVRPDLPAPGPDPGSGSADCPRLLVAVCTHDRQDRADVIEWITPEQWKLRYRLAELSGELDSSGHRLLGAAAVLLSRDIGFEYPDKVGTLLAGLRDAGTGPAALLGLLGTVAAINARLDAVHALQGYDLPPRPLCLFVGTPSRRVPGNDRRLTHLVCWRLDEVGQKMLAASRLSGKGDLELASAAAEWLEQASTTWIPVMEARPEVTRRRDSGTSAAWLADKRVLILGCGALGAPAAEICVRAGAAEVTVADNGVVRPGILVRQPYEDADIGQYKAVVLARRLNQVHGDDRVSALPQDIITTVLTDRLRASQFDLIVDATANVAVTSRLERCRAQSPGDWPPVMTMLIGHDARRGLVALARPGASGAGRDILRKLGLAACGDQAFHLADVGDDFFPEPARTEFFQPEPGCSDPTFTGSYAETTSLAAHLVTAGLDALAGRAGHAANQPLSVGVVRLDAAQGTDGNAGTWWAGWLDDLVVRDEGSGYEVRLSQAAVREMRAESARGARLRGRDVETGGMLLGEIDDACECIWIDVATGPPPDSKLSAYHFDHGTEGVQEVVDHYRDRSRQITVFVGMWHTHPDHAAMPSPTDTNGTQQLLAPAGLAVPRAIMLILGGQKQDWSAWLDDGQPPSIYVRLVRHDPGSPPQLVSVPGQHCESAWPGGFMISDRGGHPGLSPSSRWALFLRRIRRPRRKGARQ